MYQYGKTGGILSTPSFIFEELPFRCMLRNRFLISILIFLLPFSAGAQSYYFKNYQVSNGLSSNTITSILQDKKGFMWFGTRNGLNRFDGTTFRIFRNDPEDSLSLGSNSILSLYEDEKEQLWIGTYKGIYIYDPVSERFTAFKKLAGGETRYISRDSSGSIWIINNFTLSQYDTRNGQLKTFSSDSTQTIALSISPQGELWIATSYGTIKKYNPATGDFLSYDLAALNGKKPLTFIQDIYPASDSTLLIGTMNQALLFNTKTNSLTNIFQGDPNAGSIQIHKIIRQSKHELLAGELKQVFILLTSIMAIASISKKNTAILFRSPTM
jgi:ligand-binding sensor domain-containing protein